MIKKLWDWQFMEQFLLKKIFKEIFNKAIDKVAWWAPTFSIDTMLCSIHKVSKVKHI